MFLHFKETYFGLMLFTAAKQFSANKTRRRFVSLVQRIQTLKPGCFFPMGFAFKHAEKKKKQATSNYEKKYSPYYGQAETRVDMTRWASV